jgi:hypothetical protein
MAEPQEGASSADLHTRRDKRLHRANGSAPADTDTPDGLALRANMPMTTNDERVIDAHERATQAAKEEIA